jgi:hypothetical protein
MWRVSALHFVATLACSLGACDRIGTGEAHADARQFFFPHPSRLYEAQLFKIPPLRVETASTSWYIACTWDRIYFAPRSAEILPETAACLRAMVDRVRTTPSWLVISSADHQEANTEQERIALIRQRGENVVAYFRSQGLTLSTDDIVIAEDGDVFRDGVLSAPDYHQEFRVVILY